MRGLIRLHRIFGLLGQIYELRAYAPVPNLQECFPCVSVITEIKAPTLLL